MICASRGSKGELRITISNRLSSRETAETATPKYTGTSIAQSVNGKPSLANVVPLKTPGKTSAVYVETMTSKPGVVINAVVCMKAPTILA